ncbi:hypothetical protein BDR04DRAFT_1126807 [Suillus decipiens]|nr:hypothetical protein BDR04DRAFT_1126807 [Suillus decipiens]
MDLLRRGMQRLAPKLWGLLDRLLFAGKKYVGVAVSTKGPEDSDEEDTYWEAFGDRELDGLMGVSADTASVKQERITVRHNKLVMIKKVVIFSIIMQTANQKSNACQSIFGIFLQSAHTPQKVIETLSRMGICVSVDSINTAVMSLSKEAHRGILTLGRTLLASYVYDNFDVDLKSTVHTYTLKHLTAGLLFPLQHGITLENLRCSKALWERSLLNPQVNSMDMTTKKGWKDLLTLHPDPLNEAGLNSTVSGNINSGDIEDPAECDPLQRIDVSEYVVLFHGDLGTGERLQAALHLFHLKMASADAIWRTFLQNSLARLDQNALMRDVGVLRPKETGIYGSKPGFHRMHQLVTHSGICRRLDCWRVQVKKNESSHVDLDAFAASEPLFDDLLAMADVIAKDYVADYRLRQMRSKDYMLLYEELSYAMNIGDIGRVETCVVAWILIFKATGKHKYATHMSGFLCNVHFVYPDGLQRAVQYHILVNPSGKSGSFRAVDWCMELNNLYTKVIHGGKGPNRTIDCIILESPLVQVYRNLQQVFEENFLHSHLTTRHANVDMTQTLSSWISGL